MVEALINGQTDPEALAALADGHLKTTPAELEASLRGRVTAHHRFMLRLHLDQFDALDTAIARIDKKVDSNVEPFRVAIEMLTTIPGVSNLSVEVIVSDPKRAIGAVAASILTATYHMLKNGTLYQDT